MKKFTGDIISLHMCTKSQSYDVWFLRYGARQTEFFVILNHYLPFYCPPNDPKNQNFEKNEKNAWRYYYPFIHTCVT